MRQDYSFLRPSKLPPEVAAPLRVGIVPTPDFTLLSLACFVEFLRLSSDESDYSRKVYCSWELLSHDENLVYSSCGFGVAPTGIYGDPKAYDYIVVHGGLLHSEKPIDNRLYQFVQQAFDDGVPLVGLCTGQFVLAELEMLNGLRCAVHFSLAGALRRLFPQVIGVTDAPVVIDGRFITCPGGLASINLAMHLVSEHCGNTRVEKSLHYLMADRGFEGQHASREEFDIALKCPDRRVANAVGLMKQRMYETCTIAEIASGAGTTERELTRLFQKHLRQSPGDYWRDMRLKAARWMVTNSDRSITQIAYECGFTDSSHLIHWFKRNFGVTPSKMRKVHLDIGIH